MIAKNELVKNFTIGFLPILAFIIADEFFGPRIGLIVAIIVGVFELIYHYARYRRIERFVLFDTLLIILMGSISLLLHDDIFFKLKPALIEAIVVILFGIHAFSSRPVLLMMGKRYLKDMEINPVQAQMIRRMSVLLFWILLAHTILIVYSAYFWSRDAWAFISGGLFYILVGVIFIGQFFYNRFFRKHSIRSVTAADEEWFDLVDAKGKVTGRAPRSRVHGNPELMHPSVHLHIFSKQGKLYLQKRSTSKDLYPGYWDTAVGGHVSSGESIEQALVRESMEELGVDASRAKPLYRYVMRNEWESELIHTYMMTHNGPFKINRDEIDAGRFWSVFELKKMTGNDIFTPNLEEEIKLLQNLKLL